MKKALLTIAIALIPTLIYAQVTGGMVAKYSFNNGNANDEVGLNNGTVYGATLTTDRFGNPDKAYLFINGDYITLPNAPALKSSVMTVSLWVRIDSLAYSSTPFNQNFIYTIINSPTSNFFGSLSFSINTADNKYFSVSENNPSQWVYGESNNPATLKWQHYVLSIDNDSLKMYIDGVKQWSLYKGFTTTYTSDLIYIGKSGNVTYQGNLDGAVDDIRVYNRVLDSIEVDSLYHEPNPVNTVGIEETPSIKNTGNIYPNPTTGEIFLPDYFNARLTDLTGKVILEKESANSLNLLNYPSGVYFILLKDKKGDIVKRAKVIKK